MEHALTSFLTQAVFTVGVIILFGFLIAICNKIFYKNMGFFGKPACYITGFFGTPVHEIAHALMCLVFGHRIHEVKLFQISSDDGTLGYVKHSYNKKNVYQVIGNFFIGVAPITVIAVVLYLLSLWLVPGMAAEMFAHTQSITMEAGLGSAFKSVFLSIGEFFSFAGSGKWWLFLFISSFLTLHMKATSSPQVKKVSTHSAISTDLRSISLSTHIRLMQVLFRLSAAISTASKATARILSVTTLQ